MIELGREVEQRKRQNRFNIGADGPIMFLKCAKQSVDLGCDSSFSMVPLGTRYKVQSQTNTTDLQQSLLL